MYINAHCVYPVVQEIYDKKKILFLGRAKDKDSIKILNKIKKIF